MSGSFSLSPGSRLGAYEVLAPLGAGGMGEVYRARDSRLGRDVALKVVRGEAVRDEGALRRFEREAQAEAALSHPNILALHDVGDENGRVYAVMELLEGETLRTRLDRGPLVWRKAVEIAGAIADGLAAAHGKGVVHRDLKPANVFLTADGRVKVLDFGLAKLREPVDPEGADSPTLSQTQPGRLLGTVGYMSPEQVAGKPADARSDIFALGCVLHEMVSGQRSFARATAAETMTAILNEEPPEPETAPLELRRLIAHCLEKDSEARFQSARDLAFDLRRLLDSGASAGTSGPASATSRGRLFAPLAAAAVTAAVVWAAVSFPWRRDARPALKVHVLPPEGTTFAADLGPRRGLTGQLAVSPDGRSLAFVAQPREGKPTLWVRALDELSAQRLAGTEGAHQPFWSPDGRSLAFFADDQLKTVAVTGGPPQVVCRAGGITLHGAWSPEGVIVFGVLGQPLYRVLASGGRPEAITELDADRHEAGHASPVFLPGGRRFLFHASSTSTPEATGLYAASLDSGQATLVAKSVGRFAVDVNRATFDAATGRLLLLRETTLVAAPFDLAGLRITGEATPIAHDVAAFSASGNGVLAYAPVAPRQLAWLDRQGRELQTIPELGGEFFRLSQDGRRLAAMERDPQTGTTDVWVYDLDRRVGTRLTSHPSDDDFPVWSPDDEWIVFSSNRSGRYDLYRIPSSGAGAEELLYAAGSSEDPESWSSDGHHIVFTVGHGAVEQDLWVLSLPDRRADRLFRTPFREYQGLFSPNARWIAYISADETQHREIYLRSFPISDTKWRISTGGGIWPRWRRDGRELFYVTTDAPRKLMAVEVKAEGSFEAGLPRALFELPATSALEGWFAVSADGQRFLFSTLVQQEGTTPIALVHNWPALLER
jgi:Tol biopolymer transport system component